MTAARPLPTPSQAAGPFLAIGVAWSAGRDLVPPGTPGAFSIRGRVLDGAGAPVTDAKLELWQADAAGRFPPDTAPQWSGFARRLPDGGGSFELLTVKPGSVPDAAGGPQAPHIAVSIFARGLMQRLVTPDLLPRRGRG